MPKRLLAKRKHWVVFFANGYGDAILIQPTLRALVRELKGFRTLVCQEGAHNFLFHSLGFDRVICVKMSREESGRRFDSRALRALIGPCDGFLSLVPWRSNSLEDLRRSLKPAISIGHFSEYEICVPINRAVHNVELNFDFVRLFNPDASPLVYWVPPSFRGEVQSFVDDLLATLPPGADVLSVHTDTVEDKTWSDQGWRELLERFLAARPGHFAFVVGHQIRDVLGGTCIDRVIPMVGLSLEASMCLVANGNLFAGIDSCMLHVADISGVPGLGIFRSTDPLEFGFFSAPHTHVRCGSSSLATEIDRCVAGLEGLTRALRASRHA